MIALMIALYLAQDSFGTATNVTGDATITSPDRAYLQGNAERTPIRKSATRDIERQKLFPPQSSSASIAFFSPASCGFGAVIRTGSTREKAIPPKATKPRSTLEVDD